MTPASARRRLQQDGARIQLELADDYRINVASYPAWQRFLRDVQPPLAAP